MTANTDWMSSREAARALGVKLETLYAYASRGQLRSVAVPRGRGRRYAREDVERLKARHDARKGHGVVAAGALRWGEPVLETAISDVRADGPYYRGVHVLELAQRAPSFEAVAELLWSGEPSSVRAWPKTDGATLARMLGAAPRSNKPVSPVARLAAAVSTWALRAGMSDHESEHEEHERARVLLRACAAHAHGGARVPPGTTVAELLVRAWGAKPSELVVHTVDRALILSADHELNASTFAARVAASAGASLHAFVAAALHTLTGTWHGGMCDRVEALLRDAMSARRASDVVRARLARGEALPGFGHPLYPEGDARGAALLALAREVGSNTARFARMRALVEAMERAGQPRATLDAGLVALTTSLDLPEGAAASIFAVGRIAGWVAHGLEQRRQGFILRPRARYVGTRDDLSRVVPASD